MRLCEALSLRLKDVNLPEFSVTVRGGKGNKDRVGIIGKSIIQELSHQMDLVKVCVRFPQIPVSLPTAINRKYPNAGYSLEWKYIFLQKGHRSLPLQVSL